MASLQLLHFFSSVLSVLPSLHAVPLFQCVGSKVTKAALIPTSLSGLCAVLSRSCCCSDKSECEVCPTQYGAALLLVGGF